MMATIPTIEEFLYKIKEVAGNPSAAYKLETSQKNDLFDKKDFEKQSRVLKSIFNSIAQCYDINIDKIQHLDIATVTDDKELEAVKDFTTILIDCSGLLEGFQQNVWTFNATKQQVIYEIAKHMMPMLGRRYGFSNSGAYYFEYMPYGNQWFLPQIDADNPEKLILPMQTAIAWWKDLLGLPYDKIWEQEIKADYARTLQNWITSTLPKNNQIIKELFDDNITFNYQNVFKDDATQSLDKRFQVAQAFYETKKHTGLVADPHQYADNRFSRKFPQIFLNSCDENPTDMHKEEFINFIQEMWQVPSNLTLRRIFTTARLAQATYYQMCDLLNPNQNIYNNADATKNKTLQLIKLFKVSYDLTMQTNDKDDAKAYQQFNDKVPQWLQYTYFMGLVHYGGEQPDTQRNVVEKLNRQWDDKMLGLSHDTPLDDVFCDASLNDYQPAKHSQSEHIARDRKIFNETIVEKIGYLIQSDNQNEKKIEALLAEAISHREYDSYKTPILYYQAIHQLRQNKFDAALASAEQAFAECTANNSYGIWKKISAELYISIYLSSNHYDKKLEKYAMAIAEFSNDIDITAPSEYIRDQLMFIAEQKIALIEKFYHPYPSYEKQLPPTDTDSFELLKEYTEHQQDDDVLFQQWVKDNQQRIQQTIIPLKCNFVMWSYHLHLQLSEHSQPSDSEALAEKQQALMRLIKYCAVKTLNASDYLDKTLLIYAVKSNDMQMVESLLKKGVNPDAQDHVQKTALHRSIANKNIETFKLLIEHNASLTIKDAFDETAIDDIVHSDFSKAMPILLKYGHLNTKTKGDLQRKSKMVEEVISHDAYGTMSMEKQNLYQKWADILKPFN